MHHSVNGHAERAVAASRLVAKKQFVIRICPVRALIEAVDVPTMAECGLNVSNRMCLCLAEDNDLVCDASKMISTRQILILVVGASIFMA
jgi:hypothetical protein